MFIRWKSQIGMYLIRNNQRTALFTDIGYSLQFFYSPHTATWIMGITENKYFTTLNIPTETFEINLILTVTQVKRRIHDFTPQALGNQKKRMIYRSHNHDFVSRIGETLQSKSLSTNYTGYKSQHFMGNFPLMTFVQPVTDGGIPLFASESIPQHFMLEPLAQGIHYERRSTKVHISHPHGKQIITSPNIFRSVPLH